MKKGLKLWTLPILVLLTTLFAFGFVSDQANAQNVQNATTVFGGAFYDSDLGTYGKQISGRVGVILPLGEGPFCVMPTWEFGKLNTVSTEFGAIWNVGAEGKLKLGLVAGPGASWVRETDSGYVVEPGSNTFLAYITGAAGGLVGYRFGDIASLKATWGGWLGAKYVASLDKDDKYIDGVLVAGGLYFSF